MTSFGELKVSDVMSKFVISVDDTQRLSDAIRILDEKGLGTVPVVDAQNKIVGILSTSDLVSLFYKVQSDLGALHLANEQLREVLIQILMDRGDNQCVRDVMTKAVETTHENTNLIVAARILNDKKVHHLPVVDEDNHPIGMLSATDLLRAFAQQGALMAG